MSKQRQLSKSVLREPAAPLGLAAAIARGQAADARRQAEKDAPETLAQLAGAIVLGIILVPVAAWPLALVIWTMQREQYDVLSENAIRFRLSAWLFWLLLMLGAGLLSLFYAKLKDSRGETVGTVYLLSALAGFMGMVLFTHSDQAQNDLNRMRSDYQYSMRVKIVPSRYEYWADYTTPHVLVPTIGFHSTRHTRALADPCVDVHLGLLGGHFADAPYTCGTRPGRRMASAAELSPALPAQSGWLW